MAREKDLAGLGDLESRLARAEVDPDLENHSDDREQLAEAARTARQGEMDVAAGAPHRRGALPGPARPRRPAAARGPRGARDPGARARAPPAAAPRGRGGPRRRHRGGLRADPARRLDRRGRGGPRRGRARPRRSRGGAAGRPRPGSATWPASTTSWSTRCTATRWPGPSSGCGSSSSRSGPSRSSASTPRPSCPTTGRTSRCRWTTSSPTPAPRPTPRRPPRATTHLSSRTPCRSSARSRPSGSAPPSAS